MGKASRRKSNKRALLDLPGALHYHCEWRPGQAEAFTKFREYTASLLVDLPPGDPVEFAPMYTYREVLKMRLALLDEWENQ